MRVLLHELVLSLQKLTFHTHTPTMMWVISVVIFYARAADVRIV